MERRRIAVIGSGIAGLTAAYVLQRDHDVTLFEADERLGGHAHTHDVPTGAVDSGFIVHNRRTYPLLTRLFAELGVETRASQMSLSVSCAGCGLEYAGGKGLTGLLAQRRVRPAYLRMLGEVPRFRRAARRALATGQDQTLGEFAGGFTSYFGTHFLTPLISAVWSCAPATAQRYPARHLFTFLRNHGMLEVGGSPRWRTVVGGSRAYVERIAKHLPAVRTSCAVSELRRSGEGVELVADGRHTFAAAVVATHPDQALRLLAEPTPAEREVLGAFTYSRNEAVLHTDTTVLPRAAGARASWNLRMDCRAGAVPSVRVSYDMDRLQGQPYLVSLGEPIAAHHEIARMVYRHPAYTPESVAAQRRLPSLNDASIAFAGAYQGWGFHEDGCRSGLLAAQALGGDW
ncbi:NAD(P)/FAD-dependent oxidoreductase [Nonomuraea endophytica]|uniref:Putative NAD/FAD-binding protein n=1 Tax=Nonomuraea endophytica TaxID=714136 RepID=A0A7W8AF16_9ACTN|nr:FAD-dependent oxidoreductase [Nonomuraea endophytica]MBB5083598.1 putative NAD/FAD-binding protein [Nonomuraea endophytica]